MRTWKLFQANSVIINIGEMRKFLWKEGIFELIKVKLNVKIFKTCFFCISILHGPVTFYPRSYATPLPHNENQHHYHHHHHMVSLLP